MEPRRGASGKRRHVPRTHGSPLKIGTRGSDLALVQAHAVADLLRGQGHSAEIVVIRTSGDAGVRATGPGEAGKSLWTREIEDALLSGDIDLAVHSLKDLPGHLPDGLVLGAVLPREDPRDVLVSIDAPRSLAELPAGSRVGTGSSRRRAALLASRPDVEVVELKGNVPTRLRRLADGDFDAIVLAAAGLNRLDLRPVGARTLEPTEMCPALAQGIVGVEVRADDERADWVRALDDAPTSRAAHAERALLRTLDVGCGAPVGGLATEDGDALTLRSCVWSHDGSRVVEVVLTGSANRPEALGDEVGRALLDGPGGALIAAMSDGAGARP